MWQNFAWPSFPSPLGFGRAGLNLRLVSFYGHDAHLRGTGAKVALSADLLRLYWQQPDGEKSNASNTRVPHASRDLETRAPAGA